MVQTPLTKCILFLHFKKKITSHSVAEKQAKYMFGLEVWCGDFFLKV
jgi:hypothetical protein